MEIADYIATIGKKSQEKQGNQTQHLENVMNLLQSQQELLESYQPLKNHKIKKKRIVGLGGSTSTGAKGLKSV